MGPVWRLRLGYGSCSAFPTRSSTATVCYSRTLGTGVRKASHQLLASVFSSIQLAEQRGGGVSNHGSPSTEQFPRAAKDPSLLFLFQSRFQSWLMFAQKYVIADFLLINPSSTQTTSLARCYYPSAWGESRVCPPGHGIDSQAPARRSV